MTRKINLSVPYLILLAIVLIFNFLLSKYQFFITEGWFETYALYSNNGADIYKEYYYFLPPLTVTLFGFFIDIIGLDFISLRYIFVLFHALNVSIIFFVLQRYTNTYSAVLGSLLTFFLIINNPAFLAKDYHTIVSILVALSIYVLPYGHKSIKIDFKTPIYIGSLVSLLVLTKHNVGVIFGFSLFLYLNLLLFSYKYRGTEILKMNLLLFLSFVSILFGFMTLVSSSWLSIFSLDTPKGSIFVVLFRFILDPTNRNILFATLLLITMTYLFYFLIKSHKYKFTTFFNYYLQSIIVFFKISNHKNGQSNLFLFLILILSLMFFVIFSLKIAILYIFALAWPIIRLLRSNAISDVLFCIPLYALAYCGTTTAGFNSVSLEILLALFFSELIFTIRGWCIPFKDHYNFRNLLMPIIFLTITFGFIKVTNPSYEWWGLKTNSIVENIKSERLFTSGVFKDIYMDQFTYDILKYANTNNNNDLLATPSIPLFNLLSEKKSKYSLLFWYDVTTLSSLENTITQISKTPPSDIFMLKLPQFVHSGHYSLLKKNNFLPPKAIEDFVIKRYISGEYDIHFAKANIDYATCDDEFITDYINACNLINDDGEGKYDFIFYVSKDKLKVLNEVIDKCKLTHQCKINYIDEMDEIYTISIDISNQYWYKEIIETGKALHVNNKVFHTFYSFKKK